MKTYSFSHATTVPLIACALCLGSMGMAHAQTPQPGQPAWAQAQAPGTTTGEFTVELVTPQSEASSLSNLIDKPVHASDREVLSTVADFLIDPQSGRVHFAVAPSGPDQVGQTFRIIPLAALEITATGVEGLTLKINRSQWQQVGTLTEQRLQGSIEIDTAHRQRLAQQFMLTAEPGETHAEPLEGLIRATTLKGRELRSGTEQLGVIEDVTIDFNNQIAAPMLRPAAGFAGAEQRFLVPFDRLQDVSPDTQGPITANLTQMDLQQAQWGGLTPTGHFGADVQQAATAASSAVQQALGSPAAPTGNVLVVPETRLVLRGFVQSEQQKNQVEQAARQAAPGLQIDNQITVQNP